MNLRKTSQAFGMCCLCLCVSGCLGWFEGTRQAIGYVLDKGDSQAISEWTMKQTDGRKIYDGIDALTFKVIEAHGNQKKAQKAIEWCAITIDKIEEWPPDKIFPSASGEYFTTRKLVDSAFTGAASDAYYHADSEELLHRLRPTAEHTQWLGLWQESIAHLEKDRQEGEKIAAEKLPKPPTTQDQ